MHGLGDEAVNQIDFFKQNLLPTNEHTKIILLNAPFQKVTINYDMVMPSWFDIKKSNNFNPKDIENVYNIE